MARKFSIACLVLIALSACGRKGELDPPSTVAQPAGAAAATDDPGAVKPAETPAHVDKPFFLDPLL